MRVSAFRVASFVILGGLCRLPLAAQDGEADFVPATLRQPVRSPTAIYAKDTLIGDLGAGSAPQAAYRRARAFLAALLSGDEARLASLAYPLGGPRRGEVAAQVAEKKAEKFRLGGGREEADGSISFVFRFFGEEELCGEIYLLRESEARAAPPDETTAAAVTRAASPGATGAAVMTPAAAAEPASPAPAPAAAPAVVTGAAAAVPAEMTGAAVTTPAALDEPEPEWERPAPTGEWVVDDVLFIDKEQLIAEKGPGEADYLPYERFY